jgi:hypothetical protein
MLGFGGGSLKIANTVGSEGNMTYVPRLNYVRELDIHPIMGIQTQWVFYKYLLMD